MSISFVAIAGLAALPAQIRQSSPGLVWRPEVTRAMAVDTRQAG